MAGTGQGVQCVLNKNLMNIWMSIEWNSKHARCWMCSYWFTVAILCGWAPWAEVKYYALFFSSEIKIFLMNQTKSWHFNYVISSSGQDRYCPKGLIANKMSVFINLLKCSFIEEWCAREYGKIYQTSGDRYFSLKHKEKSAILTFHLLTDTGVLP